MATAARAQIDCRRLAHILDRLASDFDGEALAAGRRASEIVRRAGVPWAELLAPPPVAKVAPPPPEPRLNVDAIISAALMRAAHLTVWEFEFIHDLVAREPHNLSVRQLAALRRIAAKLRLRP